MHAQLREAVEPAAKVVQQARPGEAERREEVGDLGADLDGHLTVLVRGRSLDRDAKEALVASRGSDEQPALDSPCDRAPRRFDLVVRPVEADQDERAAEEDDLAAVVAVANPDQPERDLREEDPVRAREILEILGLP